MNEWRTALSPSAPRLLSVARLCYRSKQVSKSQAAEKEESMAKHQKRRRVTTEGFVPTANSAWAEAERERARSNAAQRHVPRPRKGTRRERQRQALRDQREAAW